MTPTASAIRFNARFLVVDAAATQRTLGGSGELEAVRFYPMGEALALDLALVTRQVLERLQAWLALPEPLRQARPRTDVFKERRWRQE